MDIEQVGTSNIGTPNIGTPGTPFNFGGLSDSPIGSPSIPSGSMDTTTARESSSQFNMPAMTSDIAITVLPRITFVRVYGHIGQ